MLKRIKKALVNINNYFTRSRKLNDAELPTPLPVGMTEFKAWAKDIIDLAGEFADYDSMEFALASMVINIKPDVSEMPKAHFVRCLRKAAANQVASQVFQDIKAKQAALAAKAKAEEDTKKQAEVTALTAGPSDEPPKNV